MDEAMFLRAERKADGTRTFGVLEGQPLETTYGEDLYGQIFGYDEQLPILGSSRTASDGPNR
jgi:hypothetical protein